MDHSPFDLGSDARLRGEPISICPFGDGYMGRQWRHGWEHCHKYWSKDRPDYWGQAKQLPEINHKENTK